MSSPLPIGQRSRAEHWRWFRRLMAWMFVFALVVAGLAVAWLAHTGTPLRLHFMIAMGLGITLSLMLGAALMGLVFVSARSGMDDGVAELPEHDRGEDR